MKIKEKLDLLMKENDIENVKILASKLDIPYSTFLTIYNGTVGSIKVEYAEKICKFFNVPIDNFLFSDNIDSFVESTEDVPILVYGTIPAGVPIELIEDIIGKEKISKEMLKGGKEFFGLRIKGNSMEPYYLNNDIIILEKTQDCESGDDVVVMINGFDGTFKRLIKNENGISLVPLNPEYEQMNFTNEEIENLPIRIIGKFVELHRKAQNQKGF